MSTSLLNDAALADTAPPDVVDALVGLPPGSPVGALRARRDTVRRATQGSFEALFRTDEVPDLSRADREVAALRVAVLQRDIALAAFYRRRARALEVDPARIDAAEQRPPHAEGIDDASVLLAFVDRLTLDPAAATPMHLAALQAQGLSVAAVVTLAQLVAFVNYLVRLLVGLRALATASSAAATTGSPDGALVEGRHTLAATPPAKGGFTLAPLEWRSWLPTVELTEASADQLAALDESNAAARTSPYYLTLVHHPGVLRWRSQLFNAIMYGNGGLPRAERELATVAVSRLNGCPYCASVHARLFAQLTKAPDVIERLFALGVNAPLGQRHRAVVDLAVDLTANPPAVAPGRLQALRRAGLDDLELLDLVHAAALFAWANRLMQTLGEPVVPDAG